jgi:hypothetical protein
MKADMSHPHFNGYEAGRPRHDPIGIPLDRSWASVVIATRDTYCKARAKTNQINLKAYYQMT